MKSITKKTYKIFFDHVRKYRVRVFCAVILLSVSQALAMITPLFYKRFFDLLVVFSSDNPEHAKTLVHLILFVFLFGLLETVFWRTGIFVVVSYQLKVIASLYHTCFEYLHNNSHRFFANRFVGSLVRQTGRFAEAYDEISEKILFDLLPLTVRISVIFVVVALYHPVIAVIIFLWILFYLSCVFLFIRFKEKYDTKQAEYDSSITANLADTITNSTNIKLFASLSSERGHFENITSEWRQITKFVWHLEEMFEFVKAFLMVTLEFLVFYAAIRLWRSGSVTIGFFVLIQTYLLEIFLRLWDFGRVIKDIYKHFAYAEEMAEILNTPHEVQDRMHAKKLSVGRGRIEFFEVSFNYAKTRTVIKNINLTIFPGEKIGIVGPSGAGKSTLVSLILRFFDLTSGKIFVDGQNIANVTQESLRKNISLVPQDPIMFHRTLMENIQYGRRGASNKDVLRAAQHAHCDEFIKNMPAGYETYVGERGIKLSGGERQRIAIARAFLKNAPILILDEATSSLDVNSEKAIQDALSKLMQGKTVITIAHRLSTIMRMDRIIVIDKGEIIEQGTHNELISQKKSLYKGLWEKQIGGFVA